MPTLFSKPKTPPTPAVAVAPPMPDASSPQITEAQDAAALNSQNKSGRQSTVLGKQGPATAADTFAGTHLGSSQ